MTVLSLLRGRRFAVPCAWFGLPLPAALLVAATLFLVVCHPALWPNTCSSCKCKPSPNWRALLLLLLLLLPASFDTMLGMACYVATQVWQTLASVLHMSNVTFDAKDHEQGEVAAVKDPAVS